MKVYISKVEGLAMNNPAVILHKDQKLVVDRDTVEVLLALSAGKIVPDIQPEPVPEVQSVSEVQETGSQDEGSGPKPESEQKPTEPKLYQKGKGKR